ncbi:MAG: PA2779 family protein [Deltaproteobacteria bacterium]|nr:PA2779 family protein [Deltaproteobacteria bacterium]
MRNLLTSKLGRQVVSLMIGLTLALALTPTPGAMAGFITTADSQIQSSSDLDTIREALENKKVSETLASLGYNSDEIESRLSQLSESEIHALAGELDQAMTPAGGSAGVIIAVVVVFLVVLGILSLMGKSLVVSN